MEELQRRFLDAGSTGFSVGFVPAGKSRLVARDEMKRVLLMVALIFGVPELRGLNTMNVMDREPKAPVPAATPKKWRDLDYVDRKVAHWTRMGTPSQVDPKTGAATPNWVIEQREERELQEKKRRRAQLRKAD